uniref:Ribonuclease Oy n=1 Tax=Lygus hesperus TaxID=30085 RepID=A0A0A9Z961_LYGHE
MPPSRPAHKNISPTTVIIAFTLFIFVSCSLINSFYKIISTRMTDNSWDVYIFTQNWPASVCLAWEEKGKGHMCMPSGNKTSWTIHGIWPTKFGEIGPSYCNTSLPFNPEAIYGIKDELEAAWSPVQKHKQFNSFWKHEWEKHGTCANTIPLYPNEFEYFNQGLIWSRQYNITNVLNSAGITPGRIYNVSAVWAAVKQAYGKNPHIACFTDSITKASYLLEIRICFSKTFEIVDCDGIKYRTRWDHRRKPTVSSGNFTDCVPNQPVEYPITSPFPPPQPAYPKEDIFILDVLKTIQFLGWATS